MWTRQELKQNARNLLKGFYWKAVVAALIMSFLAGGVNGGVFSYKNSWDKYRHDFNNNNSSQSSDYDFDFDDYDFDFDVGYQKKMSQPTLANTAQPTLANTAQPAMEITTQDANTAASEYDSLYAVAGIFVFFMAIVATVIAFVYCTFVQAPIMVGYYKFHYDARYGNAEIGRVFSIFGSGSYLNVCKTMFSMYIRVFLWSLLFVIPGIIKSYEWALVPYIMADNPKLSKERAFEISSRTMEGEKMNYFILQLSFIGWAILASIVPVGTIFLLPYTTATYMEFYCCMKAKAFANGIALPGELTDEETAASEAFSTTPYRSAQPYTQPYGGQTYGNQPYGGQPNQPYGGQPNQYPGSQPYGTQQPYGGQPNQYPGSQPYGGQPDQFGGNQPYGGQPGQSYPTAPNNGGNGQDGGYPDGRMDDIDTTNL